jgi:hypothetical protein
MIDVSKVTRSRGLLGITLIPLVLLLPASAASAKPKGGGVSPAMQRCNKNSQECNHRCDMGQSLHVLSSDGYSHCQDSCDTKFAICVDRGFDPDAARTSGNGTKHNPVGTGVRNKSGELGSTPSKPGSAGNPSAHRK